MKSAKSRCVWAGQDPLMVAYHDDEWGRPVHDDRTLFEFLVLEGAQAGLSWSTVLKKREGYRRAFAGFDARKVSRFGARDVARLMGDAGIVRNRLKIASTIENAAHLLEVAKEHGSFDAYVWSFVGGKPLRRARAAMKDPRDPAHPGVPRGFAAPLPATTPESDALSKDLKKRGFRFVGSTIIYAFMQATGLVDDHVAGCFRARGGR